MTTSLADRLANSELRLVLTGFGVGFSWASVALNCGPLLMPPVIVVDGVDGDLASDSTLKVQV
jgi:hypothetical protein